MQGGIFLSRSLHCPHSRTTTPQAIDKRLSILKRQLHERQTKGLVDEVCSEHPTCQA